MLQRSNYWPKFVRESCFRSCHGTSLFTWKENFRSYSQHRETHNWLWLPLNCSVCNNHLDLHLHLYLRLQFHFLFTYLCRDLSGSTVEMDLEAYDPSAFRYQSQWMSPECLAPPDIELKLRWGPKMDIYSYALILWSMVSGFYWTKLEELTNFQLTGLTPYAQFRNAFHLGKYVAPPYNARENIPSFVIKPLRQLISTAWDPDVCILFFDVVFSLSCRYWVPINKSSASETAWSRRHCKYFMESHRSGHGISFL